MERIEEVRTRLREATQEKGATRAIAQAASLNAATVSRFRRGIYTGDNDIVAAKLGEVLASMDAAQAIASGDWKAVWLVKEGRNVRIVKKRETVDAVKQRNPTAHVVQVWIGPGSKDLRFTQEIRRVAWTLHVREEGTRKGTRGRPFL